MTNPAAARSFLLSEVELLQPFDFIAIDPSGRPQHVIEIARREDGEIEVRIPGRPRSVPELPAGVRAALRDRDFHAEDPADPTKPWVREVSDPAAAVALAQELLTGVFEEKSDAALDLGHGNHRAEHEASERLGVARTRIEEVVTEILGRPAEQDKDGDYILPVDDVHIMVAPRAAPDGQIIIRVFAITNVGVNVAPDLGLFLARLNFGLMFGRFALDTEHRAIWFDETLLGEQFREEELRFAIKIVSSTADHWDDPLKQMFGGATYQEVLTGRANGAPPPVKPGEGVGMYL
jgi:hypothetical protein